MKTERSNSASLLRVDVANALAEALDAFPNRSVRSRSVRLGAVGLRPRRKQRKFEPTGDHQQRYRGELRCFNRFAFQLDRFEHHIARFFALGPLFAI